MGKTMLRTSRVFLLPFLLFAFALNTGCGPEASKDEEFGFATVALTDAASTDVEYFDVTVSGITLRRANGTNVGVLAQPVVVDFTSLAEVSEVFQMLKLPAAIYVSGTITLDFTGARCRLYGQTVNAAINDEVGSPLTGVHTYSVQFGTGPLVVTPGRNRVLEFDFDLDQSVIVNIPGNSVDVQPTFVMRVDRTDQKELINIGELASVNTADSSFVVNLKRPSGAVIGSVACGTSTGTVYQINGVPSIGATGFSALAALTIGTRIQTYGVLNTTTSRVDVVYLEAGIGALGGGTDIVQGHITARNTGAGSNPTLTVVGHSINAAGTTVQLNTSFSVSTDFALTKVVKRASIAAFDTDDLNVGQSVRIYGALVGTSMTANTASSVIRLQPTWVFGYANSAPAGGNTTITLNRVGLRPVASYNFTVAAVPLANPAAFVCETGSLTTGLGLILGTAMSSRGYFPAVDYAGAGDFQSSSVTNIDAAPSLFRFRWTPLPSGNPFLTITSTEVQVNMSSPLLSLKVIDHGLAGSQTLTGQPIIRAAAGFVLYAIVDASTNAIALYTVFADFTAALQVAITPANRLYWLGALGVYTSATNTLDASLAVAITE